MRSVQTMWRDRKRDGGKEREREGERGQSGGGCRGAGGASGEESLRSPSDEEHCVPATTAVQSFTLPLLYLGDSHLPLFVFLCVHCFLPRAW